MYDVIIVGAGPAGLTAALYALRANKKVLILEAKSYGGQIVNASKIDNYPAMPGISGFEFATQLYNQVKDLGAELKFETVMRVEEDKTVITRKNEYKAKTVILATGAEKRKLGLKNEDRFVGRGLSYCATCDGNFYKGKDVAIVGGGNTALEDAVYLADLTKKVYLINKEDTFNAEDKYIEELKAKNNIEIICNSTIENINGNDKIESIDIKDKENNIQNIIIDGLFIAIGQEPQNKLFSNIVKLDEFGYIIASDDVCTGTDGIYVAGDARVKSLRQLTTATSDGAIAATNAIKKLNEKR